MELVKLDTQETRELSLRAGNALAEADQIVVDSNDMYEIAAEHTKAVKLLAKEVDERRTAITRPLDAAKKATMDLFRPFTESLERAEKVLKGKMVDFSMEQERKRQAEERAAREAAEAAQRAADKAAKEESDRLLALAAQAAESGDMDKAEELAAAVEAVEEQAAMPVMVEPVATQRATAAGVGMRDNWAFEVTDFAALVRAAAERPELVALLQPNESAIRQMAKALKLSANIPGVRVYNNKIASVRA